MAGFNLLSPNNASTPQASSFPVPGLNSSATFGSTSGQQNLTFGSSITSGTSLFGSPNVTVTQSNLSFGSSTTLGAAASDANKPTFGFNLTASPAPAANTGAVAPLGVASIAQTAFGATGSTQSAFSAAGSTQSAFGAVVQPSFGAAAAGQTTFGGAAAGQPTFGTAATAPSQPVFGATPTLQPTFGGATASQQPTFGAAVSSQPLSFGGTAASQPLSFAATNSVSQPLSFGSTSTASAPLFRPSNTTQVSSFGAAAAPAVSFGAVSTAPSALPNAAITAPTLSFGPPATTQSLTFGTVSTTQPTLSFSVASSTAAAPSFGVSSTAQPISFAVTTSPASSTATAPTTVAAPSLSFATSSTSQPMFGAASGAQATPVGAALKPADATTTVSQPNVGSLSTGATTATTGASAPSLFSGLNTSAAATSATAAARPLFGSSPTSGSGAVGGGGAFAWQKTATETSTAQTSTSAGLGGVDHSAVTAAKSSASTITSVKEQPLPNEIQQTVVAFKEYVKTQKNLSSEVARSSAEPLTKLTQRIASLNNLILTLGSVLSQQKFTAERIKIETIKSLNDYELAQRIKDSPVASEERMLCVRRYFAEKISAFEESAKVLQEKIEYVYQHVITLPQENSLSAEALKLIVKKLHDSFVVIGARAYKLHNDMQLLKVQYLTLRNQYIKDSSSIAFSLSREFQLASSEGVGSGRKSNNGAATADLMLEGPNPFSRSGNGSFNSLLLTSQNRNLAAAATGGSTKEWASFGNGAPGAAASVSNPFGGADLAGNSSLLDQSYSLASPSANQPFNLQKPPSGNKRGKR